MDTVIVGAGPAGIAAAVQLRRHGISCLLLERGRVGGSLNDAYRLYNVVGYPGGVAGSTLVEGLRSSVAREHVEPSEVLAVRQEGTIFCTVHSTGEVHSRTAILATGLVPRRLEGVAISESAGRRVFYDLDGARREGGQFMSVIGGGDVAFDHAASLASAGRDVTVLLRGRNPTAIPPVVEEALGQGVRVRRDFLLVRVDREGQEVALCSMDGGIQRCTGTLVAIGRERSTPYMRDGLERFVPQEGRLEVRTDCPGLFLCGDLLDPGRRYLHHALGTGQIAAEQVRDYLSQTR